MGNLLSLVGNVSSLIKSGGIGPALAALLTNPQLKTYSPGEKADCQRLRR
jgi:hypothetical protein